MKRNSAGRRIELQHRSRQLLASEIVTLAAGAGAMYLLDPERGRRRRTMARDRIARLLSGWERGVEDSLHDLRGKLIGMAIETRHRFEPDHASDEIIHQRVRSRLGRVCSAPRAIQVKVDKGRVTLSGPVFEEEESDIVHTVERTRGVQSVASKLEPHSDPSGVPALQSVERRQRRRREWTTAEQAGLGIAGVALTLAGLRMRGLRGVIAVAGGAALTTSAVTNLGARQIRSLGRGSERVIQVRRRLFIKAPVGEVFSFWSRYENFPKFMTHLREVRDLGDRRSRWVATGPGGITAEWTAITTRCEPNREIAWKSESGFALRTAGVVLFTSREEGTELDIRVVFQPMAGAVGKGILAVLGPDFQEVLDDDLGQLKALLEGGETTTAEKTVRYDVESGEVEEHLH